MYELVQRRRGRETVLMAGDLPKVRDKIRQLRASQRKGVGRNQDRVEYFSRKVEGVAAKFKHKPRRWFP